MNIKLPSNMYNNVQSSLFSNTNLSIAKTTNFVQVKGTTARNQKTDSVSKSISITLSFSEYASQAMTRIGSLKGSIFENLSLMSGRSPEEFMVYQKDKLISAGKSDDELMYMAAETIKWQHPEELEKIADYLKRPEHDNSGFRVMKETDDQRIQAAKTTVGKMGADLIFDPASIRNELNRATQLGTVDVLGVPKPSVMDFDLQIENLAAYYAFYQKQAASYFSGAELDNKIKMLDTEFGNALANVTDYFTDGSTAKYMQADMQGINDSVSALFEERKQYYSGIINDEGFRTGVEGTENEWANSTAVFVAGKLLNHVDSQKDRSDAATSAKYNVNDLKALRMMSSLSYVQADQAKSEEHLGMMLGMDAIMIQMLQNGMSEAGKNQIQAAFGIVKQQAIDEVNSKMAASRADPFRAKGYAYDNFDTAAVDRAISVMLDALNGDNLTEGLGNSFMKLMDIYKERQTKMYQSGGVVQERYRLYDTSVLDRYGITNDDVMFFSMGFANENLVSGIKTLTDWLGNDNWRLPNSLLRHIDVSV